MSEPEAQQQQPSSHPTWVLRTQVPGSVEWVNRRVAARSVLQAEAILRRQGFVVDTAGSRVVNAPPDDLNSIPMVPGPLKCVRCGYELNGLTVIDAVIECPECGHGQVLLAYRPETGVGAAEQARGRPPGAIVNLVVRMLVGLLAVFGALILLMFLGAALLSY
ncbi:MAG: hypothetical protein ACF8R9_14485 [Phycisphaerales bacterium JB054]